LSGFGLTNIHIPTIGKWARIISTDLSHAISFLKIFGCSSGKPPIFGQTFAPGHSLSVHICNRMTNTGPGWQKFSVSYQQIRMR
jgi:hypothetical protein